MNEWFFHVRAEWEQGKYRDTSVRWAGKWAVMPLTFACTSCGYLVDAHTADGGCLFAPDYFSSEIGSLAEGFVLVR